MTPQRLQIVIEAINKAEAELKSVAAGLENVDKQTKKTSTSLKDMEPAFKKMAVAGTVAFAAISAVAVEAVGTFIKDQKDLTLATGILEKSLASLSKSGLSEATEGAKTVAEGMKYMTDNMTKAGNAALKLGYDDETASVAFAKLFAVTKDVGQANKDLALAMDLSAYSGRDLESSVDAVNKIHTGGGRILKEFGITLEEGASAADIYAAAQARVGGTAEKLSKTTEVQMRIMALQFENLRSAVGGAIAQALTPLLEKLGPIIEKFVAWGEEHPKLLAGIILVTGGIAGLVAIIGTLAVVTLAFSAVAWPVVGILALIVLGVAALVAVGILLYAKWDEIVKFFSEGWAGIKVIFSEVVDAVVASVSEFWANLQAAFWTGINFIVGLWATLMDLIFPGWQEGLATALATAQAVFAAIGQVIGAALAWLSGIWNATWDGIKSFFIGVWDAITGALKGAVDYMQGLISSITAPLESVIKLAQKALDIAGKVGNFVGGAVKSVIDKGKSITGRYTGGPVGAGQSYMVGERGPELFTPNTFGRISPNGSGGGVTIVMQNNTFMGREGIAKQIVDDLTRQLAMRVKFSQ